MTRQLTPAEAEAVRYWMPLVAQAQRRPLAAVEELDRRRREGLEYLDPTDDLELRGAGSA